MNIGLAATVLRWLRYPAIAVLLSSLITVQVLAVARVCWPYLRNPDSDYLYFYAFYRDAFVDHYNLSGWHLPHANFLFPEMPLMCILFALLPNPGYAYFAYALCLAGIICGGIAHIGFRATSSKMYALVSGLVLTTAFTTLAITTPSVSTFFRPEFHGIVMCCSLVLVLFLVHNASVQESSKVAVCVLFITSLLLAFSDSLYTVQFACPLLAFMLLLRFAGKKHSRNVRTYSFATIAGATISSLMLYVFKKYSVINTALDFNFGTYLADGFAKLTERLTTYPFAPGWFALLAVCWILGCPVWLLVSRRSESSTNGDVYRTVSLFYPLSVLSMAAAIAFGLAYDHDGSVRFYWPVLFWPLIGFSVIMAYSRSDLMRRVRGVVLCALFAWAAYRFPFGVALNNITDIRFSYPGSVACIDRLALQYDLKYGYADYWDAKRTTYLSRTGLRLNQVTGALKPFPVVQNDYWYLEPGNPMKYPKYTFLIARRLDKWTIDNEFGDPAAVENCEGVEVRIFNRESDAKFRTYLRPYVAELLGSWVMELN